MNQKLIIFKQIKPKLFFSFFFFISTIFPQTIATVNSIEIPFEDFKNRYEDYLIATGIKDTYANRTQILNNIVTEILLVNYSDNQSILNDEEFQREKKWIDNQTQLAFLMDQEIFAKLTASEEELREAFLKMNQKVEARHLYAETEEEAWELYNLLQNGSSFELLAKQVFSDSILQKNGGYLGYFTWGDFDPNFEQVAYSLPIGEISKPVETEQGFSIIRVENRITNPIIPENEFINKKKQLERLVKINKKRSAQKEYLNNLIELDNIQINENALENLFTNFNLKTNEIQIENEEIVANHNGKTFTNKQILIRISELPYHEKLKIESKNDLKIFIKGFYLNDELLRISSEKGFDKIKYVTKKNKVQNTNLFMKYKQVEIVLNTDLSDSTIQEFYNQFQEYFSTKTLYNVREILVKKKSEADNIFSELQIDRNKFGEFAKKYSLRKTTSEKNGEFGFASIEKFGLLKKEIHNAKIGELIGPIEIQGYFGIFELIDKIESKPIPMNEIQNQVESAAKFFYRKEIIKRFSKNLFDSNKIDINYSLLKDSVF